MFTSPPGPLANWRGGNHARFFNVRFVVLLLLFAGGVLTHQAVLPVLEGNDEALHYSYIEWIRQYNRLPDRTTYATNTTQQESGQPPLTYWVAARFLDLLRVPVHGGDMLADMIDVRNLWFTPPDRWNRRDNLNLFFHGPNERAFGHPDIVQGDHMARLLSLAWGLLAVVGAYGAAREVFERDGWALLATGLFAFTPQMIYMCASVTNDVTAVAFATLAIWQTLRLLRRGATPLRLAAIGVFLALGALSKVSVLLIAPGIGLALALDCWQHRRAAGRLITNGLIVGLALALIFGPWVVYGIVTFQDPLGFRTHKTPEHLNNPPPTLPQLVSALPDVYLSYWGKFGTSSVWMSPAIYALFTGITVLALAGYVWYWIHCRHTRWWTALPALQAVVLLVMVLFVFAGLVQWLRDLFYIAYAITGRLMYAAHVGLAIGLAGGLALLAHRLRQSAAKLIRATAVGLFAGVGLLAAPISIYTAYAPPMLLTPQSLPKLEGGPIDYDHTIRLLGAAQTTPTIEKGKLHRMTLCWQVLKPAARPAAFALKLFSLQGKVVGERTSVHGLGLFPSSLWRAGDIFCDMVDVPINDPPASGQPYNVLLILLDARTAAADWPATRPPDDQPVQYPFVAQVVGK